MLFVLLAIPPYSLLEAIEGRWWKIKYVAEVHLVKGRHLTRVAVKERVAFGVRRLPHEPDQAEAFNKPALAIPRTTPLARYLALRRGRWVPKASGYGDVCDTMPVPPPLLTSSSDGHEVLRLGVGMEH